MKRIFMKGNDAMAEAAVRAGCRFFAGYPITPQSEILEYLSWRMPQVGGTFVQTESEIAGVSMVYGGAAAGFRVLTSSSGPGFSLLQEGISYVASAELPCVFINVMRYGSGLGDIYQGQGDYWQTVKNGGHSDYRCLVYAPASVQESADLIHLAYNKAEEYKNPVIVLSDASIGQMMEPVEFRELEEHDPDKFDWSLKGKGNDEFRKVTSIMYYDQDYDNYIKNKYDQIEAREQMWDELEFEDAEIVLVAYGISARVCREAVKIARNKGIKLGLIRPISLYPYPIKAFKNIEEKKALLCVELSALGQMVEDVKIACKMKLPVHSYLAGGSVPLAEDIVERVEKILADGEMEVSI
ncbi:3-methyl-2-oxobutanoate dehydrogenase subunit VorB [Tepidibacter aestuarii]|uniref:3-methyl-2-oxobutanoate dehydrogenase subunit VorB n=1 Tax=Tepidibacter aestuarii TaxID=2925782 RepID=UPI0020BDD6E7|nr:3-methyl-2-oxobutanoate dehydrogenase subunit VorB [Tepidibacter aestuarii]CAH2213804.1 Ketoisovalerate oxidoreductase subunit VorB [Tepidibacter aestuarii]